jgi:hypothetical protein
MRARIQMVSSVLFMPPMRKRHASTSPTGESVRAVSRWIIETQDIYEQGEIQTEKALLVCCEVNGSDIHALSGVGNHEQPSGACQQKNNDPCFLQSIIPPVDCVPVWGGGGM